MSETYFNIFRSEEMRFLLRNYPNAFILLTCIADRARRENGHPDGLIIGDALIGSTDLEPGLSRQNFRTALNKLVELQHVEIIANGKTFLKREKSTIKVTIKGLLVNLCKSTIYNINSDDTNQHSNQRLTNDQPTGNHKQKGIRKNKKEKEEQQPLTPSLPIPSKIKFREHVELTQAEYDSLLAKHGQEFLNRMLNSLESYKGSTGKVYKSDFHTMKDGGWVIERVKKELLTQKAAYEKPFQSTQGSPKPTQPKFQANRVLRADNSIEGNS